MSRPMNESTNESTNESMNRSMGNAGARPWPVVLLTGLGAWLVAVPLIGLLATLFAAAWTLGPTAYVVGIGLVALGTALLRSRGVALFVEQSAVPLLLCGLLSLAYALDRDLPRLLAPPVGIAVVAALIVLLPVAWLRTLLGAALGVLLVRWFELALASWNADWRGAWFWVVHLMLLTAAMLQAAQWHLARDQRRVRVTVAMEPVLMGLWATGLLMLAWLAGPTFLATGPTGGGVARDLGVALVGAFWRPEAGAQSLLSAALALAGGLGLARTWGLGPRMLPPALLLVVLAGLIPTLGACLALLAWMLATARWRLAIAATIAALWVLGSFYYRLDLSLPAKAQVLIVIGLLLAAWVRWMAPRETESDAVAAADGATTALVRAPAKSRASWVLLAGGALALLLVNALIVQKQQLIANGRPVFVKLAPVDPRSLMQGDYMALSYDLPGVGGPGRAVQRGPWTDGTSAPLWGARARVAVTLDPRGIATAPRLLAPGEAAPPGTQLIELTPKNGGWTVVSDAWFFREGEEPRWRAARYGEFRVLPDGRALLVGLTGEDLQPL